MKQRKLKVARQLNEILSDASFQEFTMTGLRDGYEARFGLGECSTRSELRKRVYRRILPLVKRGYITKAYDENETPTYSVTALFRRDFPLCPPTNNTDQQPELPQRALELSQTSTLKSKLNQYQVDMLAFAGECKEYQQLVSEYPHLRDQIEPMYRIAKERSSELMGQLRAINNLLQHADLPE